MSEIDNFDDLELVPEETENLADAAINFMKALTVSYGADAGSQLFSKFRSVLGDDVQNIIFTEMLGVRDGHGINVYFKGVCSNKIVAIKSVRAATGLGLKEAKDLVDFASATRQVATCDSTNHAAVLRQELREQGFQAR